MKKSSLVLCICLISINCFAANPVSDQTESASSQELELLNEIQTNLNENKLLTVTFYSEKCKIIILNRNFRTVREECMDKTGNINCESTLRPIIYRADFIVRIDQVSYYMLQNK